MEFSFILQIELLYFLLCAHDMVCVVLLCNCMPLYVVLCFFNFIACCCESLYDINLYHDII